MRDPLGCQQDALTKPTLWELTSSTDGGVLGAGGRRMLLATDSFGTRPDSSADDRPHHTHSPVDVAHDEDEYENTTSHAEMMVYLEQQV